MFYNEHVFNWKKIFFNFRVLLNLSLLACWDGSKSWFDSPLCLLSWTPTELIRAQSQKKRALWHITRDLAPGRHEVVPGHRAIFQSAPNPSYRSYQPERTQFSWTQENPTPKLDSFPMTWWVNARWLLASSNSFLKRPLDQMFKRLTWNLAKDP